MLVLLSPAKTMRETQAFPYPVQCPDFPEETMWIVKHLQTFQAEQLELAMKINAKLAQQNYDRYQNFILDVNGTPALMAYTGL